MYQDSGYLVFRSFRLSMIDRFVEMCSIVQENRLKCWFKFANPFKPSALFVGHRQTVQTQNAGDWSESLLLAYSKFY